MNRLPILTIAGALAFAPMSMAGQFQKEWTVKPGGQVTVRTSDGPISVVGSDRKTVRLTVTSDLQQLESKYVVTETAAPEAVEIEFKHKDNGWGLFDWVISSNHNVRFKLEVPREMNVTLDTAGGPLTAQSVRGTVRLDTSGGPIEASEIEGSVEADTSGGGIEIRNVKGSVKADTSGGGITIADVTGDLVADTSGGGIEITNAGGLVHADTSGGSVTVQFARGNAKGGQISSSGGSVSVQVDPTVDLTIDANTSAGRVNNQLPITTKGESQRDELHGVLNRGGATLRVETSAGSISLLPL
jgi:hypothetical protein